MFKPMDKNKSGYVHGRNKNETGRRKAEKRMLMIAVIIALGIAYGMWGRSGKTHSGYLKLSVEGRISERENCYKPAEYRSIGILPKFPVSDRFIQGILRQGICGIDKHGGKKELNGFNDTRKYALKYTEN